MNSQPRYDRAKNARLTFAYFDPGSGGVIHDSANRDIHRKPATWKPRYPAREKSCLTFPRHLLRPLLVLSAMAFLFWRWISITLDAEVRTFPVR
jgi:hypothetical protein